MVKSSILFISLNRNRMITSAEKASKLVFDFHLHLCNCLANISTSSCPTIVCLRILSTYIFEYNLYIGDVKVSFEGRCLELLQ